MSGLTALPQFERRKVEHSIVFEIGTSMNRNIDRYLTSLILLPAVMPAVIVRQRKPWRRKDGVFMYFEGENAGSSVIGTPD